MSGWQHAATNDKATIDGWYTGQYVGAGVGLVLGPQPCGRNLFALDVDTHNPAADGWEALYELEAEHGELPATWRSQTGSGGGHLIFEAPPGVVVRNQQASGNRVAPGIDVRGAGGQIVVSPTVHPDTQQRYEWEADHAPWDIPVAVAPSWLIALVKEPTPAATSLPTSHAQESGDSIAESVRSWWDWGHELSTLGWTVDHVDGTDIHYTRPGKQSGTSAVLHGAQGPLVVWTTEIPDSWRQAGTVTADGSGYSFSPFGGYAALHHDGNRSVAAKALRAESSTINIPNDFSITPLDMPEDAPEDTDAILRSMLLDWPEFWVADHQAEEWLWEPVIPAKRSTAIFAAGGVGKSLIVLRFVLDMIQAGHTILYLDYEMTPDDLFDRFEDMHVDEDTDLSRLHYAQLPSLPPLDTSEGGKYVNRLAELVGAELVVIDTFARTVQGDENEADTVRQFYRWTGIHLKANGRAFIRIDHAGKDTTKGQRGSSAKNDDVDVVWHLKRTDDGYTLTAKKKRMGWVPEEVELVRSDDPFVLRLRGGITYPVGTVEIANEMDRLDIPVKISERAARQAGITGRNEVVRAAIRYRKVRSPRSYLVGDLLMTQRENTNTESGNDSGRAVGRGTKLDIGARPMGALGASEETPARGHGRGAGRAGARMSVGAGAQCAPPRGAHADTRSAANDVLDQISADLRPLTLLDPTDFGLI